MTEKNYKLKNGEFINLIPPMGFCFVTDKITVDGMHVGYMYREAPDNEQDSGWRFFSGSENQKYVDDWRNVDINDVNTIANYDRAIIPYLNSPIGIQLERIDNSNEFKIVE